LFRNAAALNFGFAQDSRSTTSLAASAQSCERRENPRCGGQPDISAVEAFRSFLRSRTNAGSLTPLDDVHQYTYDEQSAMRRHRDLGHYDNSILRETA
jgi:YD repeat-containing protein